MRLTDERLAHILDHPEMQWDGTGDPGVLHEPQLVRPSRSDETVRLFYEFYAQTLVGGKWLCIVVKYVTNDAFVITAHLTDKPKAGEDLWPRKSKRGSTPKRIYLEVQFREGAGYMQETAHDA